MIVSRSMEEEMEEEMQEGRKNRRKRRKETDTGNAAENTSFLEDDSVKLILGGCASIAGLGIV